MVCNEIVPGSTRVHHRFGRNSSRDRWHDGDFDCSGITGKALVDCSYAKVCIIETLVAMNCKWSRTRGEGSNAGC